MSRNTAKLASIVIGTFTIVAILAIAFSGGTVMADEHPNANDSDVVEVDPANPDPANGTYGNFADAYGNVSANGTIAFNASEGPYTFDQTIEKENLYFRSISGNSTVLIEGAISTHQVDEFYLSSNVDVDGPEIHVDPENVEETADIYGTIQDAVDNSYVGSTIVIQNGSYNEDVTVTVEQLRLESANSGEDVVIEGTLDDSNVEYLSLSSDILLSQTDDGGSGGFASDTDLLNSTFMGVPVFVWSLFVIGIAYAVYKEKDD